MTFEEFERFVGSEPGLAASFNKVASEATKGRETQVRSFGVGAVAGIGALVIVFPIVKRIVYRIGLPWVSTAERYSELWRAEAERWIDEKYRERGFDPEVKRAASEALLSELEQTTEATSRGAWERLLALLREGGD